MEGRGDDDFLDLCKESKEDRERGNELEMKMGRVSAERGRE